MSIPIILLLFINETYMLFDTFFLSKLGNAVVVSFGYIANIYYFINRSGKGIGRGVSSMIARHLGGRDFESINNIALHGALLIIILTVIFQIIFIGLFDFIFHPLVSGEEFSIIKIYLQATIVFIVTILMSEYLTEILNSEGATRLSTRVMVLGIIINIVLDYVLMFPLKLGVLGASLGTCIAYIITTLIFLYIYLVRKNHLVKFKFKDSNLTYP